MDDPDSNFHYLIGGEIRVSKDGKVYFRGGYVEHDQHRALNLRTWHTFYKNTAVRSVSVEGVD